MADALAEAAIAEIQSGMMVGLGTGRAASRGILALHNRVRDEGLDVRVVATSHATETQARALALKLVDFHSVERVDYLFDGADEVDPDLRMIKGRGGAMVRERLVAVAADRRIYMVGEEKLVDHLGQRSTLPVAIHYFGLASIRKHLSDCGFNGVVRRTMTNEHFLTDQGNLVIDVSLPQGFDPAEAAAQLDSIPGVVDHGLFLTEADEVVVEMKDGRIERMARQE
ncbi:MAG: ribose-5-phosphate isomerase RpiA [Phycisphaerales bacterium]|nr:ribose-5-phosphate isomerase RpiA [Phycisphaerales bacterium]